MIANPINDHTCLDRVTSVAEKGIDSPKVRALAERFDSTKELASWIRTLPQTNDTGKRADGPRVKCDSVTQRVRLLPGDPNCVERSILYLSAAERLDPEPIRQLATIDTGKGLHTFPVEAGDPIKLDPLVTRNAMSAGLDVIRNADIPSDDPEDLLQWVVDVARNEASPRHRDAVRNGATGINALLDGGPIRNAVDIGMTFALAEQAARLWGGHGVDAVKLAMLGLSRLARDGQRDGVGDIMRIFYGVPTIPAAIPAIGRAIGGTLSALEPIASRIGPTVMGHALRAQLASMGIPPDLVALIVKATGASSSTSARARATHS